LRIILGGGAPSDERVDNQEVEMWMEKHARQR
jgi:hypothetical protein